MYFHHHSKIMSSPSNNSEVAFPGSYKLNMLSCMKRSMNFLFNSS